MKTQKSIITGLVFASFFAAICASSALAQDDGISSIPRAPKFGEVKNDKSSWGFGLGYAFTELPISLSRFTVFLTELHYSYYLTDPNAGMRTQGTLGVYGFGLILPFPKVSVDMFLGEPTQDVQGKLGVGAYYDIAVGGAAGATVELGVRIKNRLDVSFFSSPAGIDSKRDYLEFMGFRDKIEDERGQGDSMTPDGIPDYQNTPHVFFPIFGIFIGFNY